MFPQLVLAVLPTSLKNNMDVKLMPLKATCDLFIEKDPNQKMIKLIKKRWQFFWLLESEITN